MKLTKIREIPGIGSIEIGNEVYFKTVDRNIVNDKLNVVYQSSIEEFYFYCWNDDIYIGEKLNNKIYRLKKDKLELISDKGNFIQFLGEKNYLFGRNENETRFRSYYSNNSLLWENEVKSLNFSQVLNKDYLAYKPLYSSPKLVVRNINDYSIRFEYEYDSTHKVGRTLFISQNILVVPFLRTNPNYEARIIGLDLITGIEIWNFKVNTHEFILCEESRRLFGLIGSTSRSLLSLEVIDFAIGSIENSIIRESILTDVVPWNALVKQGYLFYSDNINGCKIGVLDLNSKTIVSELELGVKSGVKISEPKIWDNKLFVLDTSKVCHEVEISFSQLA